MPRLSAPVRFPLQCIKNARAQTKHDSNTLRSLAFIFFTFTRQDAFMVNDSYNETAGRATRYTNVIPLFPAVNKSPSRSRIGNEDAAGVAKRAMPSDNIHVSVCGWSSGRSEK
ncbi:hypothetical protein E8E12_008775 [Didymella heteroderae]|uniref:Uncharacterized protein n=1 Tax=Didymella heteroderae TaxID=1769908 RepID=A0A9P4WY48_9PLEO|nr:hypothetical protein E8E12_008775 [Didymella heteroderae]